MTHMLNLGEDNEYLTFKKIYTKKSSDLTLWISFMHTSIFVVDLLPLDLVPETEIPD